MNKKEASGMIVESGSMEHLRKCDADGCVQEEER